MWVSTKQCSEPFNLKMTYSSLNIHNYKVIIQTNKVDNRVSYKQNLVNETYGTTGCPLEQHGTGLVPSAKKTNYRFKCTVSLFLNFIIVKFNRHKYIVYTYIKQQNCLH